jgi:hypothetical protein
MNQLIESKEEEEKDEDTKKPINESEELMQELRASQTTGCLKNGCI